MENRFEQIKKLVEERDRYLNENPDLLPLQNEISRRLNCAGNQHNRLVMIHYMMKEKVSMYLKQRFLFQ